MIMLEGCPSARFFFNLVSDTEVISDEVGVELSTRGDVVSQIAHALEDLYRNGSLASAEWHGWQVEITDDTGRIILSAALGQPEAPLRRLHA